MASAIDTLLQLGTEAYRWNELLDLLKLPQPIHSSFFLIERCFASLGNQPIMRSTWSWEIAPWFVLANAHSFEVVCGCTIVPAYHIYVSHSEKPQFVINPFTTIANHDLEIDATLALSRQLISTIRRSVSEQEILEVRTRLAIPDSERLPELAELVETTIGSPAISSFSLLTDAAKTIHLAVGINNAAKIKDPQIIKNRIDKLVGSGGCEIKPVIPGITAHLMAVQQ